MSVLVVAHDPAWHSQFVEVARDLGQVLAAVPVEAIEHVGSTAVAGLAAKPVLDIDIIVNSDNLTAALGALKQAGYVHRGDLGVTGRQAFRAPDDSPRRHVYLSTAENLHIKNHLAVRDVLRARRDLRDMYASVKLTLATDPEMDIDTYIAGKSRVLQKILAESSLSVEDRVAIFQLNNPTSDPKASHP